MLILTASPWIEQEVDIVPILEFLSLQCGVQDAGLDLHAPKTDRNRWRCEYLKKIVLNLSKIPFSSYLDC